MDGGRRTIDPEQLAWLEKNLAKAVAVGERAICFNHYSLVQAAAPNHDILLNPGPVLDLLDRAGNVVAWFSVHDHGGGYALRNGIHFFTLPALVEADGKNEVWAVVELYADHLTATGEAACSGPATPFYGQDDQLQGAEPAYRDNGNGTVSDLHTGLMWIQDPGAKKVLREAMAGASDCRTGGYSDWRLPTIKELYSLIDFRGQDPDPRSRDTSLRPFIDNSVFKFQYGREEDGGRIIDSQFATCTLYAGTTMGGNKTMFGVNFADGRIKGYPAEAMRGRGEKKYYALCVRGNSDYGQNRFVDKGDSQTGRPAAPPSSGSVPARNSPTASRPNANAPTNTSWCASTAATSKRLSLPAVSRTAWPTSPPAAASSPRSSSSRATSRSTTSGPCSRSPGGIIVPWSEPDRAASGQLKRPNTWVSGNGVSRRREQDTEDMPKPG